MKIFSAILARCAGNSPVTGEFPSQRPATQSFDVFFDLCMNKRLSKQSWGWWFEMPSCSLWRHCNDNGNPRWQQWRKIVDNVRLQICFWWLGHGPKGNELAIICGERCLIYSASWSPSQYNRLSRSYLYNVYPILVRRYLYNETHTPIPGSPTHLKSWSINCDMT